MYRGVYDWETEDCAPILLQEIKGPDRALDRVSGISNQGLRNHSSGLAARVSSHKYVPDWFLRAIQHAYPFWFSAEDYNHASITMLEMEIWVTMEIVSRLVQSS